MDHECYIRLTAPITPSSAERLLMVIDQKYREGKRKIHLLLSTPGGTVAHGIALYNFLKGIPAEVVTHNFGTVDSIGVILFCAGSERYSVPHARFFLHPVVTNINQPTRVDEHWLLEHQQSLGIDQTNIARIIAATTQRHTPDEVVKAVAARQTLDPRQVEEFGLVTGIKEELLPTEADLSVIHESAASPAPQIMGPALQLAAPPPMLAAPPQDSQSSIFDHGGGSTRAY